MNNTRENVIQQIAKLIDDKKAANIEKSVYNFSIDYSNRAKIECSWTNSLFLHVYRHKSSSVLYNLKTEPRLIQRINRKEIATKDVAFMKPGELREQHADLPDTDEVADGIFECAKCGSKKTTYYSLQTRSADEPMTNFITCVSCKNRWKI